MVLELILYMNVSRWGKLQLLDRKGRLPLLGLLAEMALDSLADGVGA